MAKKTAAKKSEKPKVPSCTFEQVSKLGHQPIRFGDVLIGTAAARVFSSGSYGFGFSGPVTIALPDGSFASCQVSVNIVVKHSGKAAETVETPTVEEAA